MAPLKRICSSPPMRPSIAPSAKAAIALLWRIPFLLIDQEYSLVTASLKTIPYYFRYPPKGALSTYHSQKGNWAHCEQRALPALGNERRQRFSNRAGQWCAPGGRTLRGRS